MGNIWWVGAVLSFFATAANTIGVNMQKMSAMEESVQSPGNRRSYFRQRTWAQGMALCICGSLGDFAALAITAQSVIAPIKSSALVVNLAVAHIYLEEELTKWDVIGSCAIVVGSLLSVIFGSRDSQHIDTDQLKTNFVQMSFIIYAIITAIFIGSCFLFARRIQKKRLHVESYFEDLYVDPSETMFMLNSLQTDTGYKEAHRAYAPYMKLHTFLYCSLGGTSGGQSLIFVKCVAVLFRSTLSGDNQLIYPFIYIFLLCMLTFLVYQVHYLNKALIISDAMFVVPVYQCFFITFSTIGGLIFYQEYSSWNAANWIFSSLGLIVILLGVRTLAMRDFADMEVQFVSTCNVLHGSTFELDMPLSDDETSDTMSAGERRTSLSIRLGTTVSRQATGGGVFTELSAVATPPLAREIVHLGKHLHRQLSSVSATSSPHGFSEDTSNIPGSPVGTGPLRRASSTQWKVVAGARISLSEQTDSRCSLSDPPDSDTRESSADSEELEKDKSNEVWRQEMSRFHKQNVVLHNSYSSNADTASQDIEEDRHFRLRGSDAHIDDMDYIEFQQIYHQQPFIQSSPYYPQPNFIYPSSHPSYFMNYPMFHYWPHVPEYQYYYPTNQQFRSHHTRVVSHQAVHHTRVASHQSAHHRRRKRKRHPERRHHSVPDISNQRKYTDELYDDYCYE